MRTAIALSVLSLACPAFAGDTNSYTATNLVTNSTDANLINPWGMSRPMKKNVKGEGEWWLSDEGTGLSTLYLFNGKSKPLVVTIPAANGSTTGTPTGTAYYSRNFLFATLDGTISQWYALSPPASPGPHCSECHVTNATIMVNHNASGAVYTGIAVYSTKTQSTFFAANSAGGVEAYDPSYNPVTLAPGAFTDNQIPAGYTPFGIQAVGNRIFVTFYNSTNGGGYVDSFTAAGKVKLRLAQGSFSEPWGVAMAPTNFGSFSNMILVANTGSGWIGAYDPSTGAFQGFLNDSSGNPIMIPGLWGIAFGGGDAESGPTNTLYFNGGGNYRTGVFGSITAN
jgi:uncharacterized protein (TIGR03118 family)